MGMLRGLSVDGGMGSAPGEWMQGKGEGTEEKKPRIVCVAHLGLLGTYTRSSVEISGYAVHRKTKPDSGDSTLESKGTVMPCLHLSWSISLYPTPQPQIPFSALDKDLSGQLSDLAHLSSRHSLPPLPIAHSPPTCHPPSWFSCRRVTQSA